jgi:hypothetical protein
MPTFADAFEALEAGAELDALLAIDQLKKQTIANEHFC